MKKAKTKYPTGRPMRIQARPGSRAERSYYRNSVLPGAVWAMPKAIAPGILPSPLEDLMYHGGKVVPEMEFQNVFLGSRADWSESDATSIDAAIRLAMQDRGLNNVLDQYFPGAKLACDARPPLMLEDPKPRRITEDDVQAKVVALYDGDQIDKRDLGTTIFNLILPSGTVLELDDSSSLSGLGGYHGSVHVRRNNRPVTLYYSANVFSERVSPTRDNGIVAFDAPWKSVVGTLYHELNEFRTDADVSDAIAQNDNDFLGWMSRQGREIGDQPIFAANPLSRVFQEVSVASRTRVPVQFLYSNAVHGAEGPIPQPH